MSPIGLTRVALAGLLLVGSPAAALRVCFLDDDLPRAEKSGLRGFDVELMREVAKALGEELEPVWSPSRGDDFTEVDSSDLPLARLARGDCDAVASVPGAAALGRWAARLALSRPYYGAGFEVIGPPSLEVAALSDLAGSTVAVRLQTLAQAALISAGIAWRSGTTDGEVLGLLESGAADAALVWGPSLARASRRPADGWVPPTSLRWNEHVAVRDPALIGPIDEVVEGLAVSGRLEDLARTYGLPFHAPFATTWTPPASRGTVRARLP